MMFDTIFWDLDDDADGNVQHCAAHGVRKEEVEEVLDNPIGFDISSSSGLPVAFGKTRAGRHLIVVYEELGNGIVKPKTAYDVLEKKNS